MLSAPTNRTAGLFALLALSLFALAIWGLRADVVWVSQAFYAYVWWAWILTLDAFCIWRRKSSLLTTRRHLLGLLATSSVTFWFLFEALNLRFRNWYYVGTFELDGLQSYLTAGLFVSAAFATVFVGMFEVFDALGAAKILTKRAQPRRLPTWLPGSIQALGLAMAALAVLYPYYLAPLIWGSLTFIIDPWNYRRGNRSLLRDIEVGDGRAVARLFLTGLICGLVWESLNFVAPQKWIYTVRGLENFKLFEMPVLGFLGFPALAFDAVTAFSLLSYWLCGNIGWEHPDDLIAPATASSPLDLRRYWKTLPIQILFWIAVTFALMPRSIGSIRLQLRRIPSLAGQLAELEAQDIRWPRQLIRALESTPAGDELQQRLGWSDERRQAIIDQVQLYLFKGIGRYNGYQLEQLGIHKVSDLAEWDPLELHRALRRAAGPARLRSPRLDWVRVWVLASRSRGIVISNYE